ncbi:MAG: hypothetical protein PHQ43_07710, partial [Dehalococcoidales bacterium]|nr:hypothetical protein [Dehalococcoidales bacterium]
MTTTLLQPQRLQPANEGHVNPLSADERLLCKAVQRVLKAQVAEVLERLEGGAVQKGGLGSGNFGHEGRPGEVGGSGPGGGVDPVIERVSAMVDAVPTREAKQAVLDKWQTENPEKALEIEGMQADETKVFHGTGKKFDTFYERSREERMDMGAHGAGFYF